MERYLHQNRLSQVMDGLGVRVLIWGLSTGWFLWLWGLTLPTLMAGTGLSILLMMLRKQWRRRTVTRREYALRSRLGAELLLEELLYAEETAAHTRVAELLTSRWPLLVGDITADGAQCRQGKEALLVRCVRLLPDGELSVGDLIAAQRAMQKTGADRAVLCVTGRVSPKVAARAEQMPRPVRILRREDLLGLAGRIAPATDAQLITLGQRKRHPLGPGGFARLVLAPAKARRYWGYGLAMVLLYVLTGVRFYAVPGMTCLAMAVASRGSQHGAEEL